MPVTDNSEACVSFWRITDGRKVWYDWMVETFAFVPNSGPVSPSPARSDAMTTAADRMSALTLSDPAGKKRILTGVSEICSSRKNGCLM